MAETTAISWADATVNFWMGCTAISPACDGCYARNLVQDRFGKAEWGGPGLGAGTRTRTGKSSWSLPFKLQRRAEKDGTRPFVFVNSLADTFDNEVPAEWRAAAFDVMRRTPRLVYLLLTKRPQNIVRMVKEVGFMPRNVAFGTTIEDRQSVEQRLPHMMVAAGLRPRFLFASCEPLLGDLGDLSPWLRGDQNTGACANGERWDAGVGVKIDPDGWPILPALGWIITGGETDQGSHRARPTHPDWFRSLRDQCAAAGVPFQHKQNGEWLSVSQGEGPGEHFAFPDGATVRRIGKYRAGRLLDGVLHEARPTVPAMEAAHG